MENKNDNKQPNKTSLKEEIKEEIEELKDEANLPNDFPLSGGTGPHVVHDHHKEIEEEDKDKKSSFLDDLDTEFPLSGGETEE